MKKQDILNLIRYYAEKNDAAFKHQSYEIAKQFSLDGDIELGNYIIATLADPNLSFKTQDYNDHISFFTKVDTIVPSLYMPDEISNQVQGIINATRRKSDVNKFLFVGSPGTGKTETAKIIAKQLKKELLMVDFNKLIDSKLGQTGKNISELFENIKEISLSNRFIFLFDEIDVIAFDRVNSNDLREMGRVTSMFLKEMDKITNNSLIIATTNLQKHFDKAVLRRFDAVINFDCYSKEDLVVIAKNLMNEYSNGRTFDVKEYNIVKKLLLSLNYKIFPGDLRNMLKISFAFSNPNDQYDYLRRFFSMVNKENNYTDIKFLKNIGLTYREIEMLTGLPKSNVCRFLKDDDYE